MIEKTPESIARKKKSPPQIYFTQETEDAILAYVNSDDQVFRNKIFNEKINYALFKLTQNILHTFKFYYLDGESIEDVQQELICFVFEKLNKYKQEKGKAYSYFGTIIKRYCIIKNIKNYKKLKDKVNPEEADNDEYIYNGLVEELRELEELTPVKNHSLLVFINYYVEYIDKHFTNLFPKETDAKIADSILEIFKRRNNIELLEKKAIYIYIREMIGIDTPQITRVVKKFKKIYTKLFNEYYKFGEFKF